MQVYVVTCTLALSDSSVKGPSWNADHAVTGIPLCELGVQSYTQFLGSKSYLIQWSFLLSTEVGIDCAVRMAPKD